jgi:hypothetical protein
MIALDQIRRSLRQQATSPVPSEQAKPSASEQLACARRELALRQSTYPKHVAGGRMTAELAGKETAAMAAIVETLDRCLLLEQVSEEIKHRK